MAKSRQDLLEEELDNCTEILTQQFIERDIAMMLQNQDDIAAVHEEIKHYMLRRDALMQLIEDETSGGRKFDYDFAAVIEIH